MIDLENSLRLIETKSLTKEEVVDRLFSLIRQGASEKEDLARLLRAIKDNYPQADDEITRIAGVLAGAFSCVRNPTQ